jgi:hypothetical protein
MLRFKLLPVNKHKLGSHQRKRRRKNTRRNMMIPLGGSSPQRR